MVFWHQRGTKGRTGALSTNTFSSNCKYNHFYDVPLSPSSDYNTAASLILGRSFRRFACKYFRAREADHDMAPLTEASTFSGAV
jgi:hypothetical protein